MKKLILFVYSIFMLYSVTAQSVVTFPLNITDPGGCNLSFYENGSEFQFVTTGIDDACPGNCSYGVTFSTIWLWPGRLQLSLAAFPLIDKIEVDIEDYCGVACTRAYVYETPVNVYLEQNILTGPGTLIIDPPNPFTAPYLYISSCEGAVTEIRIYSLSGGCTLSLSTQITDASSSSSADGAIDLSVTGGTTPYSYLWSNGSTNQDQSNLPPGTYSVTVSDSGNCTASTTAQVDVANPLAIEGVVSYSQSTNCTGSIDVTVTGGQTPYSYLWSNGETNEDINGLCPGSYSVTVTDNGNYTVDSFFDVFVEIEIDGSVSNSASSACTGAIDITVTGGQTPYTYLWSNGETSEDINGLCPGTYSVTVTDNGNVNIDSFFDVIYEIPTSGACCLPTGICINTDSSNCLSMGGLFNGSGTSCSSATCGPITNQFSLATDMQGFPVNGGGSGQFDDPLYPSGYNGWYFYPQTNWWNIWFYDHPLDTTKYKIITIEFDLNYLFPGLPSYLNFAVNWSTPQWEPAVALVPPLPSLVGTNESQYIQRPTLMEWTSTLTIGHHVFSYVIPDYCPEWVSIDVQGYNFNITNGIITHECMTSIPTSGACCMPDGSCTEVDSVTCLQSGGTYFGDNTNCANVVCDTIGKCCYPDPLGLFQNLCTNTTHAQCDLMLGTWDPNALCTSDTCGVPAQLGACCMPDGTCSEVDSVTCLQSGGTYFGDNTNCANVVCDTIGKCCYPDPLGLFQNLCTNTTHAQCDLMLGTWDPNALCTSDTCGVPVQLGACCMPDGSCTEVDSVTCLQSGGTYFGDNTNCANVVCDTIGKCCYPDPLGLFQNLCTNTTHAQCDLMLGTWDPNALCTSDTCGVPVQLGACCMPDGTCTEVDSVTCLQSGGTYFGDNTNCANVVCDTIGKCCYPDPTGLFQNLCTNTTHAQCDLLLGTWDPNALCTSDTCGVPVQLGACCMPDGSCAEVDSVTCLQSGGTYFGDNTNCANVVCDTIGKCCYPDPTGLFQNLCTNTTHTQCDLLLGTWDPNALCTSDTCGVPVQLGACCMPDGSCAQLDSISCLQSGGNFQGDNTDCSTVNCPNMCPSFNNFSAGLTLNGAVLANPAYTGGSDYYNQGTNLLGWYYYPSGWWNMWFCNLPYNPNGYKEIYINFDIELMQAGQPYYLELAINWSKPAWDNINTTTPPIPSLVAGVPDSIYIQRHMVLMTDSPNDLGHYEYCVVIPQYCPAWVSIDINGINVRIYNGTIDHQCYAGTPPIGRCCYQNFFGGSECIDTYECDCSLLNGTWDPTLSCITDPCIPVIPVGACCMPDGSCSEVDSVTCLQSGGTYYGDNTSCANVVCDTIGKCCYPDPTGLFQNLCTNTTHTQCDLLLGTWDPNAVCTSDTCGVPVQLGACCMPDGSCAQFDSITCVVSGGIYQGDGSSCTSVVCEPIGRCCYPILGTNSIGCSEITLSQCNQLMGTWDPNLTCNDPCVVITPVGACCMPDGSCSEVDSVTCLQSGGTYFGDNTNCANVVCDTIGKCCYPDPTGLFQNLCTNTTHAQCDLLLGTWDPNAVCTSDTCGVPVQLGACCMPDGSCAQFDSITCVNSGGIYQGDGSSCTSVVCEPIGRCCYPILGTNTVGCSEITLSQCNQLQGTWDPNLTCNDPCVVITPVGACCMPDGSCSEVDSVTCLQSGGTYFGDNTNCANVVCDTIGKCCYPDPLGLFQNLCTNTTHAQCDLMLGTWDPNALCTSDTCGVPVQLGACCMPDGSCAQFDSITCVSSGGIYQGDGSSCTSVICEPIGRCCYPIAGTNSLGCSEITPSQCNQLMGTWDPNLTCNDPCVVITPVGACCMPDGTCSEVDSATCLQSGGTYYGDNTSCANVVCDTIGKCCYPDPLGLFQNLCTNTTHAHCDLLLGTWDPNALCTSDTCGVPVQLGACCMPDGTCSEVDSVTCLQSGGTYFGDNTNCANVVCDTIGKCCYPDPTGLFQNLCTNTTHAQCDLLLGTWDPNAVCTSDTCGPLPIMGACCLSDSCFETSETNCDALGGLYMGDGTTCANNPCPVTNLFWITVDVPGTIITNPLMTGGVGQYPAGINGWVLYPSNWMNIWFYDHPFDSTRYKKIHVTFTLVAYNQQLPVDFTMAINWSTPEWSNSSLNYGTPPLPFYTPTPAEEEMYIERPSLVDYNGILTTPTYFDFVIIIPAYNPEWVSIDVMGNNFYIDNGTIWHACLPGPPPLTVNLGPDVSICQGECTNLTATGAYSYQWSTGETTSTISVCPSATTTYSVTATDLAGNISFDDITVTVNTPPTLSLDCVAPACYGSTDGEITASVTNNSGGSYTYSWSNGATAYFINNLGDGTYSVTVTDENGCTASASCTLSAPNPLMTAIGIGNVSCSNGNDGVLMASVSGGTSPYSYSWSNGQSTPAINSLSAGFYTLSVYDQNGCSTIASALITEPPPITIQTVSINMVSCYGGNDGSISVMSSGGTSPYSYQWSNGANGSSISGLYAGNYNLTVTDANNCTVVHTYSITEPSDLTLSITVGDISCYGAHDGSILVSSSGGQSPYTYHWLSGATATSFSNLGPGTYSVTVTDYNGCTESGSATVNEPLEMNVQLAIYGISCYGSNDGGGYLTVYNGVPPYTYLWSNGETSSTVTNYGAGMMSVTVTDANSCSNTASYLLTEPPELIENVTSINPTCQGSSDGSITLSVSGGTSPYSYSWSTGATSSSLTGLPAGNYSYTITDANSCQKSGTVSLSSPTTLSLSLTTTDVSCYGGNDGSISSTVTGGTTPYSYSWSTSETTAGIDNLYAGSYHLTVSDANNCTALAMATISQPTQLIISETHGDPSSGSASDGYIHLIVSGGISPYTYQWSNGASTSIINGLPAGTYCVTVSDSNGCLEDLCIDLIGFNCPNMNGFYIELDANGYPLTSQTGGSDFYPGGTSGWYNYLSGWWNIWFCNLPWDSTAFKVVTVDFDLLATSANTYIEFAVNWSTPAWDSVYTNFPPLPFSPGVSQYENVYISRNVLLQSDDQALMAGHHQYSFTIPDYCPGWVSIDVKGFGFKVTNGIIQHDCMTEVFGQCCYIENGDVQCAFVTESECNQLNGNWDSTQTCLDDCILPPPWNDVVNTGNNHSIFISDTIDITIDGLPISNGDALGVFFLDNGVEYCGGSLIWTGIPTVLAAWGDDNQTTAKDGFASNEEFNWKVWDASTGTEYNATPSYNSSFPNQGNYVNNGMSALASLSAVSCQVISLNSGWSMISSYISPFVPSMDSIFADIVSEVSIVKNETGLVYWPAVGVNMIGSWSDGEGYQIKMLSAQTLTICGSQLNPSTTGVYLPVGWSLFGYLCQSPHAISTELSAFVSDILLVKNGQGLVYWPLVSVDQIGNMNPGEGYQIKMSAAHTLYYDCSSSSSTKNFVVPQSPQHFKARLQTDQNMTLGIPQSCLDSHLDPGDEIGIFTDEGQLVSAAVYERGFTALTLWGDDSMTELPDGLKSTEEYQLRVFHKESGKEELVVVTHWSQGNGQYEKNAIDIVAEIDFTGLDGQKAFLFQNIPNPFKYSSLIKFYIPARQTVKLSLYDVHGREIRELVTGNIGSGLHSVEVNTHDLPPGTYFYSLEINGERQTKSMAIIR